MSARLASRILVRKVGVVILALSMCLGACTCFGCGLQNSPAQVTSEALAALKAQDYVKLATLYGGEAPDPKKELAGNSKTLDTILEGDELTEEQQAIAQKLIDKACDFDYEVGEETIEGDQATVKVTITTYDFATLVRSAMKSALSKSITSIFGSSSANVEKKALDAAFDEIDQGLDEMKRKSETSTGTVRLAKQGLSWKVVSLDDDFYTALLGGSIGAS